MSLIECNCDKDGSKDVNCTDAGKCSCKPGFDGDKCNICAKDFFGFPRCQGVYLVSIFPKKLYYFLCTIYFMSFEECNCNQDF